jgi:hypothetical protein
MPKKNRSSRRSVSKMQPMSLGSGGAANAQQGSGSGSGGGTPKQVGGAPGSIASSPLIPSITLRSFTDLFSGKTNFFTLQSPANNIMNSRVLTTMHNFFHNLNTSTFFAGFVMLVLNIGARYINLDLNSSTESWIKYLMSKEVLVFAVSWMGTRSIYYALVITASFTIVVDHLMNIDSRYCVIPSKFRDLHTMVPEKHGPEKKVSDLEISNALHTLEKAKKEKEETDHLELVKYHQLFKDDTFESSQPAKVGGGAK